MSGQEILAPSEPDDNGRSAAFKKVGDVREWCAGVQVDEAGSPVCGAGVVAVMGAGNTSNYQPGCPTKGCINQGEFGGGIPITIEEA